MKSGAYAFGFAAIGLHEADEFLGSIAGQGPVHQFLFHAAEFGEFRQQDLSAEGDDQIGTVSNGRVGGDAAESVAAAAFDTDAKFIQGSGLALLTIDLHDPFEGAADGFGDELLFALRLLLFEDDQGFVESRIMPKQIRLEIADLQVLTAEAQHGDTAHIGVIGIGHEEFGEDSRILTGAAAASLMVQELDAIHILEGTLTVMGTRRREIYGRDVFALAPCVEQAVRVFLIFSGDSVAQFIVHGFADHIQVAVLAEYGGDEKPVVGGAHPTIIAMVSHEGPACIF